jgi:hypothetical protein
MMTNYGTSIRLGQRGKEFDVREALCKNRSIVWYDVLTCGCMSRSALRLAAGSCLIKIAKVKILDQCITPTAFRKCISQLRSIMGCWL